MNIITVNVGQGALAIVRHQDEAIIVDCRIPPSDDRTVAYVKEMLALSLKDHYVKGLILTGFDGDHSEIVGASIILRKYRPDWVMYPKYFKDSDEAERSLPSSTTRRSATAHIEQSAREEYRSASISLPTASLRGLSDKFDFELFSPHIEDMDFRTIAASCSS